MATPVHRVRRAAPFRPVLPPQPSLDEAFLSVLASAAKLPIRYGSQEGEGAITEGGLDPIGLRRFALAWCSRMIARRAFPLDELLGLQAAVEDFTGDELVGLAKGAIIAGYR